MINHTSFFERSDDAEMCQAARAAPANHEPHGRARQAARKAAVVREHNGLGRTRRCAVARKHRRAAADIVVAVAPGPNVQPFRGAGWKLCGYKAIRATQTLLDGG